MPGPVPYTDIGGGGPNPPHGENFFDRIVDVHWPSPTGPTGGFFPTGGVFVAGDFNGNIHYLRVGLGAPTVNGDPVWQNLGKFAFAESQTIFGSAYGLVGGKEPAFVLVGGGGSYDMRGIIMASQDGLNWSHVFTFGTTTESSRSASIFGVTWDGSSFWAGGHFDDNFFDYESGHSWMAETDVLFQSADGFNWSEAGRHEIKIEAFNSNPLPPWPEYTKGLLESYCSNLVRDASYNNRVPGGVFGYDESTKTLIAPVNVQSIDYFFGGVGYDLGAGVNVTKFGPGTGFSSDPGLPVIAVATAGGSWMAAGGDLSSIEAREFGQAAIMVPSTDESGFTWKSLNPSGASIVTICGGVTKAPPP